jgi:hypothetical protein
MSLRLIAHYILLQYAPHNEIFNPILSTAIFGSSVTVSGDRKPLQQMVVSDPAYLNN